MKFNYLKIIIKILNNQYQLIRQSKDIPYDLEGLDFIRKYKDIENVYEANKYFEILSNINNKLIEDYSIYSNETHKNFDDVYFMYKNTLKTLELFRTRFDSPIIDTDNNGLTYLSEVIVTSLPDQLNYIKIKYEELFLSFENYKFIDLIDKQFDKYFNTNSSAEKLVEYMCKFNVEYYEFKKLVAKDLNMQSEKLKEFIIDCYEATCTFRVILTIYFKLMILIGYSDDNVIKYSKAYL